VISCDLLPRLILIFIHLGTNRTIHFDKVDFEAEYLSILNCVIHQHYYLAIIDNFHILSDPEIFTSYNANYMSLSFIAFLIILEAHISGLALNITTS
jgi:hypothetical protein